MRCDQGLDLLLSSGALSLHKCLDGVDSSKASHPLSLQQQHVLDGLDDAQRAQRGGLQRGDQLHAHNRHCRVDSLTGGRR